MDVIVSLSKGSWFFLENLLRVKDVIRLEKDIISSNAFHYIDYFVKV